MTDENSTKPPTEEELKRFAKRLAYEEKTLESLKEQREVLRDQAQITGDLSEKTKINEQIRENEIEIEEKKIERNIFIKTVRAIKFGSNYSGLSCFLI